MPNADVRQLKAILAAEIIKTLDKKGSQCKKGAEPHQIDAGDFPRVRNADFRRISASTTRTEETVGVTLGVIPKLELAESLPPRGFPREYE